VKGKVAELQQQRALLESETREISSKYQMRSKWVAPRVWGLVGTSLVLRALLAGTRGHC